MANFALLKAVGADRPGIVAAISEVLYRADCNIEDSDMARLGGTFACMLVLRLPEGRTAQQLEAPLDRVRQELALWLHVSDLHPAEAVEPPSEHPRHVVEVRGADRPGIVYEVTSHLSANSVNITNLNTHVYQRTPPMYLMTIEVEVPHFVDAERLQAELVGIGRRIGVDVALRRKAETTL